MRKRHEASDIIMELRDGRRLGVSVTQLKKNIGKIADLVVACDREVYVTRCGNVIAKLIPYRSKE